MTGRKKILMILAVLGLIVAIGLGVCLWLTSPTRTYDKFSKALEAKDMDAAMALVATDITASRRQNIEFWVEDWVSYDNTPSVTLESDEAWFERVKTDADGNVLQNRDGDRDKEIRPAPRYWSHLYSAYANVHFDATDDYEAWDDPMIITFRRKSDSTWSALGNVFRGWEISRIRYQELSEEELNALFDDVELDTEDDGEVEFELDDNGDIVFPTDLSGDEFTDDGTSTTDEVDSGADSETADDAASIDEAILE